jgi:hypothetical protein
MQYSRKRSWSWLNEFQITDGCRLLLFTLFFQMFFRHCANLAMNDIAIWLNGKGQVAVCVNY